jgi:murein DD-endopeptidase MepM/ murein hydrolase activator NlpD
MVTGAHLHYEFLVDGVHRNPRTVDLPKALPIAKDQKAAFNAIAKVRLEELSASKRVMLAMLNPQSHPKLDSVRNAE